MHLINLLNRNLPSWGQSLCQTKSFSPGSLQWSWTAKRMLLWQPPFPPWSLPTEYKLIREFVLCRIGIAAVDFLRQDLSLKGINCEHKYNNCCSGQTTVPVHRSSPLTLDMSGRLEKSMARWQSSNSLSSDCSCIFQTGECLCMEYFHGFLSLELIQSLFPFSVLRQGLQQLHYMLQEEPLIFDFFWNVSY